MTSPHLAPQHFTGIDLSPPPPYKKKDLFACIFKKKTMIFYKLVFGDLNLARPLDC